MDDVGFEALMLWATIGQELFSCFATTLPDPPSCVYLFQKGKNSHFDLCRPPRLKSVGLLLLFWCFRVEMYNNRTCALKRKKKSIRWSISISCGCCVFFFSTPPWRNVCQSGSARQLWGKMSRLLQSFFFVVPQKVDFEIKDILSYIIMCRPWCICHTDCLWISHISKDKCEHETKLKKWMWQQTTPATLLK